jgi:hypothetical protein
MREKNDTRRPKAPKSTLKRGSKNSLQKYRFNELSNFESIEKSLRQKILSEVRPELGSFFFQQHQELKPEEREQ